MLFRSLTVGVLAGALLVGPPHGGAQEREEFGDAVREVARVRAGLGVGGEGLDDRASSRTSYGRPAVEVEGWRVREDGSRWPVDQATYDRRSGLLSKYVNFDHASRRQAGEAILPMGTVSARADGYLGTLYPGNELSLEGIERYRVEGRESVYYELRYSPQPVKVAFLQPLVRILVNASTGSLYRYELAADHLRAGELPGATISSTAAGKVASLFLQRAQGDGRLGGEVAGSVTVADLYFVRPNRWLDATVPGGGEARAAWVVQFRVDADGPEDPPRLLFVDALNGHLLGGMGPASPQ